MKTLDMLREMRQVVSTTKLNRFTMELYHTVDGNHECGYKACIMGEIATQNNLVHFNIANARCYVDRRNIAAIAGLLHNQLSAVAYKELGEFVVNIDLLTASGPSFMMANYSKALLPQMLKHPHVTTGTPRPADTLACIDILITHIEERYNAEQVYITTAVV